ncbi:MAG: sulfur carrier protein ThiS [Nevskiales bacterium]|nr:sulfur carrier protein ThiS [Nevskiales bacterium]
MRVTLNGRAAELAAHLTLEGLLQQLQLKDRRVAVELNGTLVPRSAWAQTAPRDGDRLEIVHAIGGG